MPIPRLIYTSSHSSFARQTASTLTRAERSSILQMYPSFTFDSTFAEKDDLKIREIERVKDAHMTQFLEYLFDNDGNTFIGLTSHLGVIAALLRVTGHKEFKPNAGDVFPILVKGESVSC